MADTQTEWLDDEVEVVESEAEIAEALRTRRAGLYKRALEETEAVLIVFDSTWAGNEYLGDWYRDWLVHVDFETDNAIHITVGVNANYTVSALSSAERARSTSRAERVERNAFNWEHARQKSGACYLSDEFCPKSQIESVIRTPTREDHLVFEDGERRNGALDEGELRIRDTRQYVSNSGYRDEKFVVEGDTYEAFKECHLGDALPFEDVTDKDGNVIEPGCYQTYDGDDQLLGKEGLTTFVEYANEAGFSVAVHSDFAEYAGEE